jgi:type VI secretion system protein VasD
MCKKTTLWLIVSLLLMIVGMGCGKKTVSPPPVVAPPPVPAPIPTLINVEVIASLKVNPNNINRPSPIVVRLYELKSLTAFNSADFDSLFNNDKALLGDDLVKQEQFTLRPGGQKIYRNEPSEESHYLGAVAAYRNIDRAAWRTSAPLPAHRTTNFTLLLNPLGISIQAQ